MPACLRRRRRKRRRLQLLTTAALRSLRGAPLPCLLSAASKPCADCHWVHESIALVRRQAGAQERCGGYCCRARRDGQAPALWCPRTLLLFALCSELAAATAAVHLRDHPVAIAGPRSEICRRLAPLPSPGRGPRPTPLPAQGNVKPRSHAPVRLGQWVGEADLHQKAPLGGAGPAAAPLPPPSPARLAARRLHEALCDCLDLRFRHAAGLQTAPGRRLEMR